MTEIRCDKQKSRIFSSSTAILWFLVIKLRDKKGNRKKKLYRLYRKWTRNWWRFQPNNKSSNLRHWIAVKQVKFEDILSAIIDESMLWDKAIWQKVKRKCKVQETCEMDKKCPIYRLPGEFILLNSYSPHSSRLTSISCRSFIGLFARGSHDCSDHDALLPEMQQIKGIILV